jgi:PPOX class probable F420-dependent enzyme
MPKMSPEETLAFLEEPHIAHLVTLRPDGSPHVAPVWYEYRNDEFLVIAMESAQKIKNLRVNSTASISVASEDEPYRYVLAEGAMEIRDSGFDEVGPRIAGRYKGAKGGAVYAEELKREDKMLVLTMKPRRIVSYLSD